MRTAEANEKATVLPITAMEAARRAWHTGCAFIKKENGNVFFFGKKMKGQGDE